MHPNVHTSVIYNSQAQPKCPSVNGWIKKLWYIYIMEYYAVERKKELLLTMSAWMELDSIMIPPRSGT